MIRTWFETYCCTGEFSLGVESLRVCCNFYCTNFWSYSSDSDSLLKFGRSNIRFFVFVKIDEIRGLTSGNLRMVCLNEK